MRPPWELFTTVWLHEEGTEMRRLPKEEITSRLQNASSQFCFRWSWPVWYLWASTEEKLTERSKQYHKETTHWFRVQVPKTPQWMLSPALKIHLRLGRQHVFCLTEYQFNTTCQLFLGVFINLSIKHWTWGEEKFTNFASWNQVPAVLHIFCVHCAAGVEGGGSQTWYFPKQGGKQLFMLSVVNLQSSINGLWNLFGEMAQ